MKKQFKMNLFNTVFVENEDDIHYNESRALSDVIHGLSIVESVG